MSSLNSSCVERREISRNGLIRLGAHVHSETVLPFGPAYEKSRLTCTGESQAVADVLDLFTKLGKVGVAIPDRLPIILVQDGECLIVAELELKEPLSLTRVIS